MSNLNLDESNAAFQIRAFQPGTIQINEKILHHSVIVTPDRLIENWTPQSIDALTDESLAIIIELKPDVLLIGTGSKLVFLPAALYGNLINHGIGVEVMDTRAACRTFNALAAENRNVIAALIIR